MADDGMFAPLPSRPTPRRLATDPWRPILPVPDDAPSGPPRHRHGEPSGWWAYRDKAGKLLGYVLRFDQLDGSKEFAPATYCEHVSTRAREWRFKAWLPPRPLYGLDRLARHPGAPVVICEGEKAADAAGELLPDHVAVASPNGAKSVMKTDWRALAGRDVTLWPDNDDEGRAYAVAVVQVLGGVAASVKVAPTPADAAEKWDAADALAEGWDRGKSAELIAAATPGINENATPRNSATDDAEIARLAALPLLKFAHERVSAAKRLGGIPVSMLDRIVAAARSDGTTTNGQGRALNLPEPEPWPKQVDGAALLDELTAAVRRYVVLGEAEAVAVALWIVATHAFDAFAIFPRLFVTAPEKGCGKSTLLDVLLHLVPRPLGASNITAAALFRVIEAAHPTLLLDEADSYIRDNEDLRGVLDAGHRRDGAVIRTVGDDHEPRQFSAWAPVALAAIGRLPGTIEDRSIKVGLRRRRPDEPVQPLRLDRVECLERPARMAARWSTDHAAQLAAADPAMPAGIVNRVADNWRPLLAVADLAGGGWPERARKVAAELSVDSEDSMSAGVLLLADLHELFASQLSGVLFTREILTALHADETRPWPEWKSGKPITERQLASLLKPHKIRPKTVRRGIETEKGYRLDWFADAFASYLPPQSVTASQSSNSAGFEHVLSVTLSSPMAPCVTDARRENPCVSAACDGVTFPEPPPDDDGMVEFLERAAIREFEGGYLRAEAERLARAELGPWWSSDRAEQKNGDD